MAKRPTRSDGAGAAEANDAGTVASAPKSRPRSKSAREVGAAAVANREADVVKLDETGSPAAENISSVLGGGVAGNDRGAGDRGDDVIQQAPGDAVSSRTDFGSATENTSTASEPSEEDIRLRAYEMYLERGGEHGRDYDDWVRAAEELRRKRTTGD